MVWTAYHQDRRERGRTAASLLGCCSFPRSPFSLGCFLAASLAASGRVLRQHPETGGLFCQVACFLWSPPFGFWGFLWQPFRAHNMEEAIELREAVVSAVCAKEVMALAW